MVFSQEGTLPRRNPAARFASTLLLPLVLALPASAQGPTIDALPPGRHVVVSLDAHRLWLVQDGDTLLSAPVAVGRRASFHYQGKTYDWRTPRGQRVVLAKRTDPVWTVPEWHYYERAANENLRLVPMVRNVHYPLADGSHLQVLGDEVVRVLGDRYWKVPRGRELVIDGVLYVPPLGTQQRKVPGVLGTRALDLGEGYLIHGTNPYNRGSIGTAASHGCIRMETADLERLYELVAEGTRVLIQ